MTLEQMLKRQEEIIQGAKKEGNRALSEAEQKEFDQLQVQIEASRTLGDPNGGENSQSNESQRAIEAERNRIAEITNLFRGFDENPEEFIRDGKTLDQARAFILEKQICFVQHRIHSRYCVISHESRFHQ